MKLAILRPERCPAVDSSGHALNATYGTTSQNGYNTILAPQTSAGYKGFAAGQALPLHRR